jgi:hypothetical protein
MLDLLAHGLHHGLGSVDAHHQASGCRAARIMPSTGAQAMSATKQPWP